MVNGSRRNEELAALILNGVHGVPVNHVPAILHALTSVEMTASTVKTIALARQPPPSVVPFAGR